MFFRRARQFDFGRLIARRRIAVDPDVSRETASRVRRRKLHHDSGSGMRLNNCGALPRRDLEGRASGWRIDGHGKCNPAGILDDEGLCLACCLPGKIDFVEGE
jgi:hypothetical protein